MNTAPNPSDTIRRQIRELDCEVTEISCGIIEPMDDEVPPAGSVHISFSIPYPLTQFFGTITEELLLSIHDTLSTLSERIDV